MRHVSRARMTAGFAAVTVILLSLSGFAASPSVSEQTDWKLAVVFRRSNERRTYVGTVSSPSHLRRLRDLTVAKSSERASANPGAGADYEVWLAGDGVTRGLWYSSARRVWGTFASSQEPPPERRDDGTLQRLIREARLPVPEKERPPDTVSVPSPPGPPLDLEQLCRISESIVVGRVAGILRKAHTPVPSTGPWQHTVYVVAVEEYLKTGDGEARPLLKIWQNGGSLPWTEAEGRARGVGWQVHQDPLLTVGSRYILFLRLPDDPGGAARRQGYRSADIRGVRGKTGELDELIAVDPWRAKILLRHGMTRSPAASGHPALDHWRFDQGPQILDVPEGVAVRLIRDTAAKAPRR